jgi:hypothetical protein
MGSNRYTYPMKNIRSLNGYRVLYKPEHFNCMTSTNWIGYVYEHRYLLEVELGRPLLSYEVVHHLDGSRDNNRLENLIVLSEPHHLRLHMWLSQINPEQPVTELHYCPECSTLLQGAQKFTCSSKCNAKRQARIRYPHRLKPSKEELQKDIESMSWTSIGKKYSISDNGARKWAKSYNLL